LIDVGLIISIRKPWQSRTTEVTIPIENSPTTLQRVSCFVRYLNAVTQELLPDKVVSRADPRRNRNHRTALDCRSEFTLITERQNRSIRRKNHCGETIEVKGKLRTAGDCVALGEKHPKIGERDLERAVLKDAEISDSADTRWTMRAKRAEKAAERNGDRRTARLSSFIRFGGDAMAVIERD
jgi:hypothetical protein